MKFWMRVHINELLYFRQLFLDSFSFALLIIQIVLFDYLLDFYHSLFAYIISQSDRNIFLINLYYFSKWPDNRSYLFSYNKMPTS